ncbi:UPF0104 family protein [Ramlibacter sp. AW1]|uniref:UPF0104 family protein n=1 Tax=Ramlibacter aurantiacus TaxID=2801330 RepID=A0A936ZVE7_9BURK|nr:lysylphosphatidylglycerol synthase domain-containing protein [Ramlibacter aurantiacus]MBL0421289.1 UPF0104 family protein [Ramlibacter aurantiacus]
MTLRAGAATPAPGPPKTGTWWGRITRVLTLAFFAAVAWFIVRYARTVEWARVWEALIGTPGQVLAGAAALTACSFALISCFDLLGRHYTGHQVPALKVFKVNFISYAFNLNLGAIVGGIAFRFRMYSQLGLDNGTIGRVMSLSMLTNWLGYLLLGGVAFLLWPLALPPEWNVQASELRWLGAVLVALALAYIALCMWSPRRSFMLRGHELLLPPRRMVPLQLVMSCGNWMIMGAIIWLLLQGQAPYPAVLNVLLVAAMAGVITHVPAGLGVLEAVFIALLAHRVPEWQLIAALLGYRALYYIAPLMLATLLYLWFEARTTRPRPPRTP